MSAPSDLDLSPGFALSPSAASLTAAQLLQLVSEASPYTDKGMVVVTTDTVIGSGANQTLSPKVPDAATTTKWQRYIWIRISPQINNGSTVISGALVSAYIWNPGASSDATYLCWTAIGIGTIGPGTITGSQIAAGTITDANISDVDWSKLLNVPSFVPPSNSVTAGMLQDGSVIPSKLVTGGSATQIPRINSGANAFEWFTQKLISYLADPSAADAGKPVIVNATGTGYILGTTGSVNLITKMLEEVVVGGSASSTLYITSATTPSSANLTTIAGLELVTGALQASSTLVIDVSLQVSCSVANRPIIACVVDSTSATPTIAIASGVVASVNAGQATTLHFSFTIENTSTATRTFNVCFGSVGSAANTVYLNSSSAIETFGGTLVSSIKLVEHI